MQGTLVILTKEIASFFNSLIAYLVMSVFLVGLGLFFWVFPGNILETGAAEMNTLFSLAPWFYLFLIPAITMRSFAEEFKTGTIEFLATKPLTDWQIILGKYLAAVFLVAVALLPTLLYYITIYYLGNPVGNLDHGATWGAYLGLLGVGAVFAAIGLWASSLTENQIVAFIIGVFLSFMMYAAFDFLAELPVFGSYNEIIIKIGIQEHYRSISRGVVDSRDVIYYFSLTAAMLLLCKTSLVSRKQ
jgi:ABC-2 type transport system permease protein